MTILYILAAILMLGIMVTVHECGHFLAARLTGIPVKEFAIGFGPKLVSWKSRKHETTFFWRLIPAGGYCMFYGEDDTEGKEAKTDPRAIGNHKVWKRFITILMGPVMNFLLALVVASSLFALVGEDQGEYGYAVVQSVAENSAAAEAGLQPGDILEAVNGQDAGGMAGDTFTLTTLIGQYQQGGAPLSIRIRRGEETLTRDMAPRFDEAEGRYMIGVMLNYQYTPHYVPASPLRCIQLGADYCVRAAGTILTGLRDLVTTGRGLEDSSGPVGIIQLIAEETQTAAQTSRSAAWLTYAQLLVLISVNLGLFNLIPIPGLDGSRLIFLLIEAIRRKPVPQKVEAYVHTAGYLLLVGLMLVMTYKDVLKIFR